MARLEDFRPKQHGTVARDKKLERMLDRVGRFLDEADVIVARATPDDPPEDAPPTPVEELGDLLSIIRDEISQFRYPNWWSKLAPQTRKKIDYAAGLKLAGRSWNEIEDDFRYRNDPFPLNAERKRLIRRRAKLLAPVKELLWQHYNDVDNPGTRF